MDEHRLPDPPLLGRTLDQRYALRAPLGRGGMGEVYLAEDLRLHRAVAVKVLRPELTGHPAVAARFEREARTAGSLAHPNIVSVHDAGVDGSAAYLVMELVDGQTLADAIRRDAPFAPRRAALVAERIADALGYAHVRGVVHRDIAPGNVMLTAADEVKVLDFGIARADRARVTAPPSVLGTPAYVAPEQARGEAADRRSDVYALGAVLHELLTGEPPGSHREPRASIPRDLRPVVERCLASDPDARYARAVDLAAALRSTARSLPAEPLAPPRRRRIPAPESTPVLASAPTIPHPPAPPRRPSRTRRWATAAVSMLAALAVWFVALPVWHALSDPTPPPPPRVAALAAPTSLTATGTCDGFWSARIDLAWRPSSRSADAIEIFRADREGGPFRLRARVGGRTTAWSDRGLGLGDSYRYVLRAVDGSRISPLTAQLAGDTPSLCLG